VIETIQLYLIYAVVLFGAAAAFLAWWVM